MALLGASVLPGARPALASTPASGIFDGTLARVSHEPVDGLQPGQTLDPVHITVEISCALGAVVGTGSGPVRVEQAAFHPAGGSVAQAAGTVCDVTFDNAGALTTDLPTGPVRTSLTSPGHFTGTGSNDRADDPCRTGPDPVDIDLYGTETAPIIDIHDHVYDTACDVGGLHHGAVFDRFTAADAAVTAAPPGGGPGTATLDGSGSTLDSHQQASLAAVRRGTRSVVAASVSTPAEAVRGSGRLAANVVLAGLLVLLLVFPSELFNSTFSKHHERIERALGRLLPWRSKVSSEATASTKAGVPLWAYVAIVVAVAVISGFLDPRFGLHMASLALVLGILAATMVGAALAWLINRVYRGVRRAPTEAVIKVIPLGLAVAAVCVVISRLVHFQPGYLYGAVGGIGFVTALESSDDGRSTFFSIVVGMAVAVGAWFAFVPVSALANHAHPGLPILIVDAVLASLFIGGIEGALLGLVPLQVLPGHAVSRWSWAGWGVAAFAAAFLFVDVLLRPQSGYLGKSSTASTAVTYGLFAFFGMVSVLFWAWFRLRPDPAALSPATD